MHLSSLPDGREEPEHVEQEDEKTEEKEYLEEENETREEGVKEKEEMLHGEDGREHIGFGESLPPLMLGLLNSSLRGFFSRGSSGRLRLENVDVL